MFVWLSRCNILQDLGSENSRFEKKRLHKVVIADLLAVADLNSRLCGCTTPIEWGVVWGTEQAALAQAVLCQPCGSQHTGLEYNCTPDM